MRSAFSLLDSIPALGLCLIVAACSNAVGGRPAAAALGAPEPSASAAPAPSSYDQTCAENADCVGVPVLGGPSDCTNCVTAAINRSGKAKYDAAMTTAVRSPRICPCPAAFPVCA